MNMIATVATKEKAWQLADKLFPTDYSRNEPDSLRAGYPIFNTTSTDSKYKGFHISDLNAALELNMGAETIRINISEYETKPALEKADKTVDREAEIKDRSCFMSADRNKSCCFKWLFADIHAAVYSFSDHSVLHDLFCIFMCCCVEVSAALPFFPQVIFAHDLHVLHINL